VTDVEAVGPPPGDPPIAFVFPSDDAQIYPVIALPPFAGAVQETVSWSTPAVAVGADGVAGTVDAVILLDADEDKLDPIAFIAVTVNVYATDD
jgi:hypothetical protein